MDNKVIGPVLPDNFERNSDDTSIQSLPSDIYGPQIPSHLTKKKSSEPTVCKAFDDDDSAIIGPALPGSTNTDVSQLALDERAEILKFKFLLQQEDSSADQSKREAWMTELPPERANQFGLEARKFRKNDSTDKANRSLWTETPSSKKKRVEEAEEPETFESAAIVERNKAMDEIVKKTKKHSKRDKTLLEIHRKKLKKEKKHKHKKEKTERRPFDRDTDLQVNRFDDAQKALIIKKAQLLDTRFSAGQSKYL